MMLDSRSLTDEHVERAATGTRPDIERVGAALEPRVRVMVAARLGASLSQLDAVEEIAQQALMAIVQSLPKLERQTVGGLRSLASVIVSRRVADFLRGKRRTNLAGRPVRSLETTVADMSRVGPLWQFLSAGGPTPLSAIGNADQVSIVLGELGRLDEAYREIITLAFFDQLATREIAERLGVSRRAASMMLLRAVRALRKRVVSSDPGGTVHG